jgi:hypothetical protein
VPGLPGDEDGSRDGTVEPEPRDARDAAPSDTTPRDAPTWNCAEGGTVGCGALPPCGPIVELQAVLGTAPAAQGGALGDGTYELRQAVAYYQMGAPISGTFQITRTVSQGTLRSAVNTISQLNVFSGPYSLSGTTLSWNVDCPADMAGPNGFEYTATPAQLVVYEPAGNSVIVLVHARVP